MPMPNFPHIPPFRPFIPPMSLPAVYGDELSYMELLGKVEKWLSDLVESNNLQNAAIVALYEAWEEFKNGGYREDFETFLEQWFADNQEHIDELLTGQFADELAAIQETADGAVQTATEAEQAVSSKVNIPVGGTNGQVLSKAATDTGTAWTDPIVPTDEQTETYINKWLNEHPEATTTVQDYAITTVKIANGAVTDEKLNPNGILSKAFLERIALADGADLNDVTPSGLYLLSSGSTYINSPLPSGVACFLFVYNTSEIVLQIVMRFSGSAWYKRRVNLRLGTTWEDWQDGIQDLSIGTEKIANNAITNDKLARSGILSDTDNLKIHSPYSLGYTSNPSSWITKLYDRTLHVAYSSTNQAFWNAYSYSTPLDTFRDGEIVELICHSEDKNCYAQLYIATSNSSLHKITDVKNSVIKYQIPNDITQFVYRVYIPATSSSRTIDADITIEIARNYIPEDSMMVSRGFLPDGADLNDVRKTGFYMLSSGANYVNTPINGAAFIVAYVTDGFTLQLYYAFSGTAQYKRRYNVNNNTWEEWQTDAGNIYNNNYTFNEYSQELSVTSTPAISSAQYYYLPPNGVNDMTADILTMLQTNGVCRLGTGDYYVKNLIMPAGTAIIGSGYGTVVHLLSGEDSFAFKLDSHCLVSNLHIKGADNIPTFSSTVGTRHGILWQGTYTQDQQSPIRGMIDNVWIENFSGGGITLYDTGYSSANCVEVVNAYIYACCVGINISYFSEFSKFTSVRVNACYYGCINNGGNNTFVNCDFSSNREYGFVIDNSQGQSPNNSHGSCVGCVFNHTGSGGVANSGIGINILNADNGFVFNGCQIFFSRIHIEDSDGIVISNSNFGNVNCGIEISGGGSVLFMGNMHQALTPVTISDNNTVVFDNCYVRANGSSFWPR